MYTICETCGALGPREPGGWHVRASVHAARGKPPLILNVRCGRWVPAETPDLHAEMDRLETLGNPRA